MNGTGIQNAKVFHESNDGVLLFQNGHLREAISRFESALKTIMDMNFSSCSTTSTKTTTTPSTRTTTTTELLKGATPRDRSSTANRSVMKSWSTSPRNCDCSDEGGIFVFSKAVVLKSSPSLCSMAETDTAFFSECAASMLYNLGLCHHILAVQERSDVDYKRASDVYYLALANLQGILSPYCHSFNHHLMQIALFNNLGHVLKVGDHNLLWSRECFKALGSSLLVLMMFGREHTLNDDDQAGLTLNTLLAESSPGAAAA